MDIVERLKEDAEYHRWVSYDADCSPEATINHKHHVNALEAADEIERLRKEYLSIEKQLGETQVRCSEIGEHLLGEIERLREALKEIDKAIETWLPDHSPMRQALQNFTRSALQQKDSEK